MSTVRSLASLLERSAREFPENIAVTVPGGRSVTYSELCELSDRVRDRLVHMGVRRGDRVGLRLHKSIEAVATIFGALKAGAAYVPVDAESPAARAAYILNDCDVKVVVTERELESELVQALGDTRPMLVLDATASRPMEELLEQLQRSEPAAPVESIATGADDIAYILYTSGSTGNPKGVVLSHGNALSFIDWCSETFAPRADDRFSSHAPFHFDLSILDIYVSLKHGATLVLIGEALGKEPLKLAAAIAAERISVWYSTPSILSLLANYGKLAKHDFAALRMVFFAGEVFPIPQYRALQAIWTRPRYFNLYGPTETNVCTWYEVTSDAPLDRMSTFPIGKICPPNLGRVVNEQGEIVSIGEPGELLVAGPNVMRGYWNLPDHNERAFFKDEAGALWYRTGDIVCEEPEVGYRYVGRRDRMVKRRGYRVELGEIEAALLRHPDVREGAVVAIPNPEEGVRILAFVACQDGTTLTRIALKAYSAQALPPYMIPDIFAVVPALPRTSTDKIDYQRLKSGG
ncbi:amino acid adenylation domain-containing protein [Steroidobacter flavus]|uniref:Amino acid adenylation domain-containing protein n=1 Tax=Steroidobacter flavus TaxID=1842136 RepID=A0ABV8SZF8_9GAMM